MATYPDWREPVRILEELTGPPSTEQYELGGWACLNLSADEPRPVVGARLRDHLAAELGWRGPGPASLAQISFIEELREGNEPFLLGMTSSIADGWIRFFLMRRTIAALRRVQPAAGDLVRCEAFPDSWDGNREPELVVVSSVDDGGRVWFRGGSRFRSAWPTRLEAIARSLDQSTNGGS